MWCRTRRLFLTASIAAPLAASLTACAAADVRTFPTIASAQTMLDTLLRTPYRTTAGWKLPAVLENAAQSVEYSLGGFPEMKSAAFRATAGTVAFAVFEAKGSMNHSLTDPIPGAPVLGEPPLDHAQYTRAHLMHLANHWAEVVQA